VDRDGPGTPFDPPHHEKAGRAPRGRAVHVVTRGEVGLAKHRGYSGPRGEAVV